MTKTKDVQGVVWKDHWGNMYRRPATITVRVTSDEQGKSLSLTDERKGVQIVVPLEPLADMLEVVD